MTHRRGGALAAAMVGVATLGGCPRGRTGVYTPDASGPSPEAHRVVSISPATTETLFAVGAGDRVVGRSRFCDWPPAATRLPVVGGVIDADFEAIVQLSPDLVVGDSGPSATRLVDKLRAIGIASWFPNVDSLTAVDDMILEMGARTGHASEAHAILDGTDGIHARIASVERAVAGEPTPRVLMMVDVAPVVATGPKDFVDELLRRAGVANVLTKGAPWQTLSVEQIVDLDPDWLIDASSANGDEGESNAATRSGLWTSIRAVREGHVVSISDSRVLRPGPRIAEGVAVLAHALHPHAPVPAW